MGKTFPLLTTFLISFVSVACSHNQPDLKMLDERADYEGKNQDKYGMGRLDSALVGGEINQDGLGHVIPKSARLWIFPHETPSKEYFWGGWLSVVVDGDRWDLDRPKNLPKVRPNFDGNSSKHN